MAKKPRYEPVPFPEPYVEPPRSVILDQVGTGHSIQTFGYCADEDGLWAQGEPECHRVENQTSASRTWRPPWRD